MINIPTWTISCGSREIILDKTSTTKQIIDTLQRHWIPAFYFFTQGKKQLGQTDTQAEELIAYVIKHNLGEVHASPELKVRTVTKSWIWVVNRDKLQNHEFKTT